MKLLIDKLKLELLLERRRENINKNDSGADVFFAGFSFFLSTACAEFKDIWIISGISIKTISIILGIGFSIRGIYMVINDNLNKYTHLDLGREITDLNEIQHRFSLVAIKDTFNEHPNRFLLYYDERWDCKFFFSYKTVDNDEENIKNRLSHELKINSSQISTEFKTEKIQKKFSVSHNEDRVYDHRVYYAEISEYKDNITKDEFEIDGKKFFWMTIQQMERDKRIAEINSDVIGLIKGVIG